MDLYMHSPIRLYGVALNQLSTETTLSLLYNVTDHLVDQMFRGLQFEKHCHITLITILILSSSLHLDRSIILSIQLFRPEYYKQFPDAHI
jgi:hypothetical protein